MKGDVDPARMFDQLEKKVEKTLDRLRAADAETEKARRRAEELQKDIARLNEELAAARKELAKSQEWKAEIGRLEEERGKVRERVGRLLSALETIDANES